MNIKVFLPDSLLKKETCYLRGSHVSRGSDILIYMTDKSKEIATLSANIESSPHHIYCRYGDSPKFPRGIERNKIEINNKSYHISSLTIDRKPISIKDNNVLIIFYDYETLSVAENWNCEDQTFHDLHSFVTLETREKEHQPPIAEDKNCTKVLWSWLSTFVFCVQLKNFADIMMWLISTLKRDRKISLKSGNMLAALLTDITIGYIVLSVMNVRSEHFSDTIMDYIEVVVNCLRYILKWLMGAPAGLKLNTAFNNMLGKFFLYHIDLWWMFLELTKGGLQIVSQVYHYSGYLGITFQAAIISDMISFISFHAYCIYVYVARLFNIQVSGLFALLRLFVGRKRNPLRGGVDSCEYSNQELFVGTVAFTILLFLLPTTAMYYIVFTLFRVLSLAMKGLLLRVCYCIKTLPLYVVALYMIGSPRVAGNIHMEVLREQRGSLPLVMGVKLTSRPLGSLVRGSRPPPLSTVPPVLWTQLLSNVLHGRLIGS